MIDKNRVRRYNCNKVRWSYSRVNTYHNCPRSFYYTYMEEGNKSGENCFSQYGSFIHKLIEGICENKISKQDAYELFRDEYEETVTEPFPYNKYVVLRDKYYQQGLDYFRNYEPFPYDIMSVEEHINYEIGGYKIQGYIDLLLKKGDDIIILDHKSKADIAPREHDDYFKQLYIYSIEVERKYNREPLGLVLNLFRAGKMVRELFSKEKQQEAADWFVGTIEKIKVDKKFERGYTSPKKEFFCREICSNKELCFADAKEEKELEEARKKEIKEKAAARKAKKKGAK